MNLTSRRKNIHIDNNDNEEEEDEEEYEEEDDDDEEEMNDNFEEDEENADDVSDDEEEEDADEPDFMDNSGKCWEFGSKIRDEKHLKEWCQNKMGGIIVGKEEKLTRQFHCQIKECQFKAIFLKSCSIVYTRNKHTHAMKKARNIRPPKKEEKTNPSSIFEQNYVDNLGKLWPFHSHIGKNIQQDKLFSKFGFTSIKKCPKILYVYCQKNNPAGGRCSFAGIYLKSNGCLYTRGHHEHTKRGKTPQNIGDDYMDHFDNIWKFNKEIGKNVQPKLFSTNFGFGGIVKNESGFYLSCKKKGPNGNKCKFTGVFLNTNGCLYTRGKHSAHIEKNPNPNIGDDYVDRQGKRWQFHAKIDNQKQINEIRNKFDFTLMQKRSLIRSSNLNFYCKKRTNNDERCPIKGIYLNSNECFYIRGNHEHKLNE